MFPRLDLSFQVSLVYTIFTVALSLGHIYWGLVTFVPHGFGMNPSSI